MKKNKVFNPIEDTFAHHSHMWSESARELVYLILHELRIHKIVEFLNRILRRKNER